MATFDEREKAYERKFEHDEKTRFKIAARRNKLLGLWAADLMGLKDEKAEAYAKEVVAADFDRPGDEDVYERVSQDLAARGVDVSEERLRKEMRSLLETARAQILAE